MAGKKLKVEVELDTNRARRQLKGLSASESGGGAGAGGTGGGGAGGGGAAALDRSLTGAARAAGDFGDAARRTSANIRSMTKMFGGMAVRMATSYAAGAMEKGSSGQKAVSAAGEIASGALMGSMFGPIGAAAGALMGAANAWINAAAEERERARAIDDARWNTFQDTKAWRENGKNIQRDRELFDSKASFGNLKGKDLLEAQLDDLQRRLGNVTERKTKLDGEVHDINQRMFAAKTEEQAAAIAAQSAAKRGEYDRMDALGYSLQRQIIQKTDEIAGYKDSDKPRRSYHDASAGLDALSRLGASFGGGTGRDQLAVAREQLDTLRRIEQKTGRGGSTWQ